MTDAPDLITISLLGGVDFQRAGTQRALPSTRAVSLLAYLVLRAGTPQPRQHLATLLWPDSAEAQARTNLRRELHHVRSVLAGSDALQVGSTTLCWRDGYGCRVDVREFELAHAAALAAARDGDNDGLGHHTARALEEYRGSLLPGWYDDWALQARDELAAQCVDLCDRAAEALRSVGDLRRAAELARRRTTLAPLEESGYRLLIELQSELDDRAGAMRTYHRCASVLERELGMTPAPETTALIERLLGTDAPPPGAATGRPGTTASAGPAWYQLVGRDADVGRLMNAWDAARAGRAGAVVIIGEAGIGKSRLVGELSRDLARDGAVTALARCFETSGRPPFAPVADWLRTPALQLAKARLEPAWRAEADRLDPQSRSGTAPDVVRAKVDAWQRRRFFEGLARTVLAVQRPTLLVLEDLQWCDRETLAWIVFVMSLGSDMPLLLVATAREDQLTDDPGVAAFLHTMTSSNRLTRLALAPLTRRATGALGEQLLGRPVTGAEADLLHSVTGGNPLFIVEAARGFPPAGGPGTLDRSELVDVLHRRLAQATPGARELAGLAAAVGRDFSLPLLSEASDLGAEDVVLCVDELWRRRILREVGRGYDFTHDLLRDAAYDSVPPARRWLLHRRLAQGLELVHADDLDGFAGQLAEQYDRSDQPDRALRFYARAAEHASRLFAHADAVRMRRRCLELIASRPAGVDRDELELDTLRAMAPPLNALHGYASRELQSALQRAEHLAGALGRRETQLVCLVGLFASSFVQGATAESQRIGARALELAQSAPDLVGQAHFAYGGAAASLGRLTESVHHLELACELSVGDSLSVGTRSEVHSRAWMAHPLWLLGRESDAVAAAEQAVKQARTVEHPYTLAVALAYARRPAQDAPGPRCPRRRAHRADRALRALRVRVLPRVGPDPDRLAARRRRGPGRGPARGPAPHRRGLDGAAAVLALRAGRGPARGGGRHRGTRHAGRGAQRERGLRRPLLAARGAAAAGHPAARRARRGDAPGGRRAGDGPAEPDAR